MKLLIAAALLTSGLASAQITLNNSDFADGGDTVRMSSTTDPAIDFLSTGSNYSWDFSGLVGESQVLRSYNDLSSVSVLMQFLFGGFAPPNYQATNLVASDALPLDQMGAFLPVSITEVNSVSKNSADSITSIGISMVVEGTEVPFKSDTIETRYKFPANYGDVYSSRGYSNIDLNPIFDAIWIQYRQRNSNIDGWGEITTPFGTFDALRIRHVIQEQDSIYIGTFGTWIELPIPPSTIYEWWTTGELEPILRITTSDLGGTETVTDIEYRDSYDPLLVGMSELIAEVNVYPNPAHDELTLDGLEIGSMFVIVGSDGKLVQSGNIESASQNLSLTDMAPGSYILYIRNVSGTFAKSSFVKQ